MSIRKKTIIIICLTVLILTSVYHYLSIYVLGNKFKQIEESILNEHIVQALEVIQENIDTIDTLNLDWSRWDDSYEFINNGNKEFITSNLSQLNYNPIKLNLICFINTEGQVVYKGKSVIQDSDLENILKGMKDRFLYKENSKELNIKASKGILSMEDGIMIISYRPIVRSDGRGPARGILIMGRYLSNAELYDLGSMDNIYTGVQKYYGKELISNYNIFSGTLEHSNFKATVLDEKRILGSTVLKDLYGEPKLELLVETDREIYLEGKNTRIMFNSTLIISGFIFGIIILLILEKIVLIPLQSLSNNFMDIEKERDLSYRLPVKGNNEFDNLSRVANKMLEALSESSGEIEESEHRYRHLFESLIDAFAYLKIEKNEKSEEIDYVFLKVNHAYEKLIGLTDEEISGKIVSQLYCSDKEEIFDWIKEINIDSKIGEKIQTQKYVNVRDKWFQVSAYLPEDGYIITIYQDITELKDIEYKLIRAKDSADAANEAKSQFLANMSHEIRTPINAIIGMNELLKDTNLNENQKELVVSVENAGNVLLNIVNSVLDFSKIEAGKFTLNNHEFNINSLIKNLIGIISVKADEKGIGLSYTIAEDIPEIIYGDENRLNQVILNLLSNAIKFTFDGEVNLKVLIEKEKTHKLLVRFEVFDTGIGIDSITQEKLFEPFVQGDSSTTRKYGGTGLGLSICKRLVGLMGGTIGVKSNSNEGSLFWFNTWFSIPNKDLENKVEAKAIVQEGDVKEQGEYPLSILLVEDNDINKTLAIMQLEKLKTKVKWVKNGEEAVKEAFIGKYDLILMDCQMPIMDGYDATKKIRNIEKDRGGHIAIIAMTANSMEGDREKCIMAGMDDYMAKPIRLGNLEKVICKWCN